MHDTSLLGWPGLLRGCRTAAAVIVALYACPMAIAGPAPEIEASSPDSVLLFKSGQAFLTREVPLVDGGSAARVVLPASVHGTVWLGADGATVERAVARYERRNVEHPVLDLTGLLRRSVGRQVSLEIGEDETLDCRVLRLLEDPGAASRPAEQGFIVQPPRLTHVAVAVDSKVRVLPIGRISSVTIEGRDDGEWTFEHPEQVPVLEIEWSPDSGARRPRLELSNLATGLAWAPSYVLELGDDDRSRLTGKAVVINDVEDLDDTEIKLVIGFPNIEFAAVSSPLMPSVDLAGWANMLRGRGAGDSAPVMMQQVRAPGMPARARVAAPAVEIPGDVSEDLYVYDLGRSKLAKGERAYLPLTREQVRHEHRFDWTLADTVRNDRFADDGKEEAPPVWHVLKLWNGSDAPWTTAPILVLGRFGPLAQSQLGYTAPGSDTLVRLTQALDIVGTAREVRADETPIEREAVKLFGNRYERIEVRGRLELDNRSRRSTPMHVVKTLSGDILSADGDPKIEARAASLGQVNASRTLTWDFELGRGENWSAEYRYEVLIRR